MNILSLLPFAAIILLVYLIFRLINQTGDFYKKKSFWISWVMMSLLLMGLLFYVVLKGLNRI